MLQLFQKRFIHFIQPFTATAVGAPPAGDRRRVGSLHLPLHRRRRGKWLDKVHAKFLKQLQNVSKTFHPLHLAIYLPIHHYGIHNSGGPPKAAPTVVEAAEGRLHIGGWGDK